MPMYPRKPGPGRGHSTGVHALALNVDCEGEVLVALLCLFHVDGCSPSGDILKYSHTQKVRCAFHICVDSYQILTLLCCLLPNYSCQEWHVLMYHYLDHSMNIFQFAGDYGHGLVLPKSFLQ